MDCFIGMIKLFPYDYAPLGWHLCDGAILPIYQNQALFSLIGIQFGGDGRNNFALPDMRGAEPDPGGLCRYYIAMAGLYPIRP